MGGNNSKTNESVGYNMMAVVMIINVIASLLTLGLIGFMRRNGTLRMNLYVKCVLLMTIYQTIADYFTGIFVTKCGGINVVHWGSFAGDVELEVALPVDCAFGAAGLFIGGYGSAVWSLMLVVAAAFTVEVGRRPTYREEVSAFVAGRCRVESSLRFQEDSHLFE